MSILNVNQIQPVGSGQTVTISAANITASSSTISASSFVGPLTGNATGLSGSPNLSVGILTASSFSGDGSGLTGVGGLSPYFGVEMRSNVAISHNTETEYTAYTAEVVDSDNALSAGRFTPQTAGKYYISFSASPEYDQKSISSSVVLRLNGSTKLHEAKHRITGSTSHYSHSGSVVVNMNGSTDYVSIFLYQYNYTDSVSINFDFITFQGFRIGD